MIAALLRFVTGVQDRWVGVEPVDATGGVIQRIYFANHTSHLDAPVIWASLPPVVRADARPVAARDYWDRGVRKLLAEQVLRCVLVERDAGPKVAAAPMEAALGAGESLILFPEGTRNPDPEAGLLPFRAGLYHLAMAFPHVELVPVYLANLNRMLPKGELLPVPLIARVTFGPPVARSPNDPRDVFLARARGALLELAWREGDARVVL